MPICTKTRIAAATAAAVVTTTLALQPARPALAAKGNLGGLKVMDCNVRDLDDVPQNAVVAITFTTDVDPASVHPAVFQVRERNATGTGFARQIAGSFQAVGRTVRFYPRLPTHLRDPASPTGDFYPFGAPRDDAMENAGLHPGQSYEIRLIGGSGASTVRSTKGRKLGKTYVARFTTTPEAPKTDAFTIESYGDAPPPGFQYSNPSDKVAAPVDQYARRGGTREVPNAVDVTLFGRRVPIDPGSLRQGTNVTLTMAERNGNPALTKPIRGVPYLEQNFDGTRVVFKPNFPLPDRGVFVYRMTTGVKDLTGSYDFRSNPERLRLRDIYEVMSTAQVLSPQTPPEDLPDPDIELIFDWPKDAASRGVLKRNILTLGAAYPYEVDPRVMVLFSTRDEPVSNGSVTLRFEQSDGLYDPALSTANYDSGVPGAASANLTIAGGSGADGDFTPTSNVTINVDGYPNRTINWRRVNLPPNVRVTITGTRPATIKSYSFVMESGAELIADGTKGADAPTAPSYSIGTTTQQLGGPGGPGGGRGGNSGLGSTFVAGGDDVTSNDSLATLLSPPDAGGAGRGGGLNSGTMIFDQGGGGGGGGARLAGEAGANAPTSSPNWSGSPGGAGGAGSSNFDLVPFGGGAGGGAGAGGRTNTNPSYNGGRNGWGVHGGGAGGGGGALLVQTSGELTMNTNAAIRSRGGAGGRGSVSQSTQYESGPGGGGGGGSLLIRSTKGFNLANPATATDVRGGARGLAGTGSVYGAPYGGRGGEGYVLFEDPSGGPIALSVPGSFGGVYAPVGGGVPSLVYTKWFEVGVDQPRFLNYTAKDFVLNAAGNDAILIEAQFAVEDTANFGKPLLTAVRADQTSSDVAIVSQWTPIRVVDLTGNPAGAFGPIQGYDPSQHGTDHIFPIDAVNGRNYRFLRVRITFQLDDTQSSAEPFPFVDEVVVNFQFNI